MIRISPYKISSATYEKVFAVFYEVVGRGHNKEEFNHIFFELLSPAERIMIVKRIAIIYLLMKNIDYETICSALKVSNSTVSKFRILMEDSRGIVPALKKIVSLEKIALMFEELFSEIFAPGVPGVNWKAAWERKMALKRRKQTGI
jgi:Trp operon repressor